jgi:hypothetical protein
MAANMVLDTYDDLIIAVHTSDSPNEPEWDNYLSVVKRSDPAKTRTIVFTDGGAPNSAQREALNKILNGVSSPGAIVSANRLVRGVVTTLSWFNPKIKAFSPERTEEAFSYLGLKSADVPRVWIIVRNLREKLGAPNLQCIPAAQPKAAVR